MPPLRVVEPEVTPQPLAHHVPIQVVAGIDVFVFDRSPEAFDKNVVIDPTTTIHADPNGFFFKACGELRTRKLAPLIRIEDFWF